MSEHQSRLIAGAMSGTSADGVDVAITRITGHGLQMSAELVHHHHVAYDASLRGLIFKVRESGSATLAELAQLGREISLTYGRGVNESLAASRLSAVDLTAIAAHGQTLYHDPPNTIQWLDPALIASEVRCAVVSDFRRADCAVGGQGAPLVPFADYILFRHPTKTRVLLNIGGIANITWLKAGGTLDEVIAFDTGPGNCVIDYLCRKYEPTGPGYDVDGEKSKGGVDRYHLSDYLIRNHPFFRQPPPKSTDGPTMIAAFESAPLSVQPYFGRTRSDSEQGVRDLLSTASLLTARSIQNAHFEFLPLLPDEVIVSGGGVRNATLMQLLRFEFPPVITTTEELGINGDAKEGMAFALLAAATLDGVPSNVPSVTGAKRAVILGSITPRP
jgi:anhydro-N-acetylmuramic acid kinase